MLQALYSRNPASIATRIEALTPEGAQKFMDRFYLNYGHNSIADCGHVTLFFEGVPMHVAKAIQSHALYNGKKPRRGTWTFQRTMRSTRAEILA
jgi:hypothetical protein